MVMPPSYDMYGMKKGAWSEDEDNQLKVCIQRLDGRVPNWRLLPRNAGLKRCGKSCRLRWMNYLRPGLNRTKFSELEHDLIIELHNQLGNKWSAIAANFPGRTDNDIKNYWHAHVKKRRGAYDRASRAQSFNYNNFGNDQQQSSDDDISSCITTLEEVVFHQGLPAENTGPLESNADSYYNGGIFDIDLPPLIPEAELIGFGCDVISDYSKFFLEDLLIDAVGEEFFSMGIW